MVANDVRDENVVDAVSANPKSYAHTWSEAARCRCDGLGGAKQRIFGMRDVAGELSR